MKKVKRRLGCSPTTRKNVERDQDPNSKPNLEQVFPPPSQRPFVEDGAIARETFHNPFVESKSHRCTYFRPSNEDFGQLTDGPPDDVLLSASACGLCKLLTVCEEYAMKHGLKYNVAKSQYMVFEPTCNRILEVPSINLNGSPLERYYQHLLQEICCDPNLPGTTKPEMINACQGSTIQTCSQFVEPASLLKIDENVMADTLDDPQWQTLDSVSDVDMFLGLPSRQGYGGMQTAKKCASPVQSFPSHIRISETPRVRRIAEKFSKFKKNNIELRRLDERVVCLEYDIYDQNASESAEPLQKMRAFFSIKSKESGGTNKENIPIIPSGVKRDFNIDDGDFQKLNKKEIEIIDGEIPENRSLLEDLKRVLRRKRAIRNKKRQETLDLMCLYEMARRECPPVPNDYSNTNFLSKAELQEIKDLILKKCDSSVHGINRRTVQYPKGDLKDDTKCVISDSLMWELMKEPEKV